MPSYTFPQGGEGLGHDSPAAEEVLLAAASCLPVSKVLGLSGSGAGSRVKAQAVSNALNPSAEM